MTANQIEYWKLQEAKRHNIATESMERPVKEAQARNLDASTSLFQEQVATEETRRAANLASAAASYASAAQGYATAERQYEAINTEKAAQREHDARTQNINMNTERGYIEFPSSKYQAEEDYLKYIWLVSASDELRSFIGGAGVTTGLFGDTANNLSHAAISLIR